jgi:hypothetical protein
MTLNKNLIVIGGGVAVAVFLCLAVVMLARGVNKFKDTERELDDAMKRLRNFYFKNPFPSDENVNRARQNVAVLNEWSDKLLAALREEELNIENRSPTYLMDLLGDKKDEFAAKAKKSGTTISDDFWFGFDRYFQPDVVPDPADVRKLTHQLIVVENLCNILFEEEADEIVDVTRDVFEKGVVAPGGRPSPRVRRNALEREELEEDPKKVMQDSLYDKLHFVLEFNTCEVNLWNVMNRIASHEIFMVVTSLELHNKKKNMHPIVPKTIEGATVLDEEGVPIDKFKGVPPRRHRMVSGKESGIVDVEIPMTVSMEIDVYAFKGIKGGR